MRGAGSEAGMGVGGIGVLCVEVLIHFELE